jgi:hypothetical protein
MPLKLYEIGTTLFHPDCRAIVKGDYSLHKELFLFFEMNLGNEEKIKKLKIEFDAGKGYTLKNIANTDYISTASALLFSRRFVNSIGEVLKNEMQFFPCKVICRGSALNWYMAKITHLFPVIDKELSTYYTSVGNRMLKWVKYRTDIEEQFYVARDSEETTFFVVSDLFKKLCEENDIMIEIKEPLIRN